MNYLTILLVVAVVILSIRVHRLEQSRSVEGMSSGTGVDINSIKEMNTFAQKLASGTFEVPSGLHVKGPLTVDGNINCGGGLGLSGGATFHQGMVVHGPINFRTIGDTPDDVSDPFKIEKVNVGGVNHALRVSINDNAEDSFQIWGDSCGAGDCHGRGRAVMVMRGDGINFVHQPPLAGNQPLATLADVVAEDKFISLIKNNAGVPMFIEKIEPLVQ